MAPKVPRLLWDEPLRALDALASMWSSTGLQSVTAGAAQAAVSVPYRTLFTTFQQLLIGKRITIQMGNTDVTLTVTELDSELESSSLAVGQLGEVRVAACDIEWDDNRLEAAVAVLHNVHIRPGVPPVVVAAPIELSTTVPGELFDDVLNQAAPQLRAQLREDGSARLQWARRPTWGSLEVDAEVVGTTLWLRPRALLAGNRRWKLPARTPARPVPLPDLPHGLLVTGVTLGSDTLQLSALLPEWRMEVPLKYLEDLISRLSQGALSFAWPSFFGG
jgi:LmeA-like phospholipid-binding